jgi:hypothetical protein
MKKRVAASLPDGLVKARGPLVATVLGVVLIAAGAVLATVLRRRR